MLAELGEQRALLTERGRLCEDVEPEVTPLEPAQAGPHEGTLPKALSFLTLEGENLQITALKQAEDRPGNYILRLFNPTENAVQGALILFKAFKEAWLTNMDEERKEQLQPKGNRLDLNVPKKKILTIEFAL